MTDFIAERARLARAYCPGCEPDADPLRDILDVRWCELHTPPRGGTADGSVTSDAFMSGSAEAGGETNRRWCELLHREARRPHSPSGRV